MKRMCFILGVGFLIATLVEQVFAEEESLKMGAGIGVPYGVIGANFEMGNKFAMSGGLGWRPGGPGWAVGGRAYLKDTKETFRPRVGLFYGTVCLIEKSGWFGTEWEAESGFAPTLGFEWRFASDWVLDFDVVYLVYDEEKIKREQEEKGYTITGEDFDNVKISFGIGRRFW